MWWKVTLQGDDLGLDEPPEGDPPTRVGPLLSAALSPHLQGFVGGIHASLMFILMDVERRPEPTRPRPRGARGGRSPAPRPAK